jgi:hypothetical protein
MMICGKDKALLTMKCCTALFLIFMLYQAIYVIRKMNTEYKESGEIENDYNDVCSNYYLFHVFAFVLGAFWNVKKLLKLGIV